MIKTQYEELKTEIFNFFSDYEWFRSLINF